jgi:hypothetical protein
MLDQAKHRREFMRWVLMLALYNARPIGAWEELLLSVVQGVWPDASRNEARLNLDYLLDRKLIELKKEPSGRWFAELNRYGVDMVEYNIDCAPGIARPEKYAV